MAIPTKPEPFDQQFVKKDAEKPRHDLLPWGALDRIADVLTFGARKYAPNNWRKVDKRSRYAGAALRHLSAYQRGEDADPETGLPHLAHAATCLLFLLECDAQGLGEDDRPTRAPAHPERGPVWLVGGPPEAKAIIRIEPDHLRCPGFADFGGRCTEIVGHPGPCLGNATGP